MAQLSLLTVLAHPDDETFGTGGTLARYAAEGVRVSLVCATRGEAGQISNLALASPDTLGQVREQELRCACQALGVSELRFLGYRDSGMAGTPENEHPRCLHRADPEQVVGRIVRLIRELRPQVVITFEPGGGYGHPDHIAVSRYTTAAFHAAGAPERYPEHLTDGLEPYSPGKLYYQAIPHRFLRAMAEHLAAAGMDIGPFAEMDLDSIGLPDEMITTVIDVGLGDGLGAKMQALACHQTQIGPDSPFRRLPQEMIQEFVRREYFCLAEPVAGGQETDLFAGLELV